MSQSNVIAGALALAFLLFITLRGELPAYLDLFKPKSRATATGGGQSASGGLSLGSLQSNAQSLQSGFHALSNATNLFMGSSGGGSLDLSQI